jgi:hypothetical protein
MTAATGTVEAEVGHRSDKLTLLPLVALVVGSMIGGGVFNLPSDMSRHASPGAILIGWIITGIGMLMLAFVYIRAGIECGLAQRQALVDSCSRTGRPSCNWVGDSERANSCG